MIYIPCMLIIIDMQYEFKRSAEKVVEAVCEVAKEAIAAHETIVLVEYACDLVWHGHKEQECECRTFDEIMAILNGYDKLVRVVKSTDGGGDEVIEAVESFPPVVDVCGVNTNACVRETVVRLATRVSDTEFVLLVNACNSTWHGQSPDAHLWVDGHRNVRRAA
jgi:nicotinamidase-related amidase